MLGFFQKIMIRFIQYLDIREDIIDLQVSMSQCSFPFISTWGWGTWKSAWETFDHNSKGSEKLFRIMI